MSSRGQFRFDAAACTGCEACVLACRMANRAEQGRPWRRVHTGNALRLPDLPVFHLSVACHHCLHPACLVHCPAQAYSQDPATGAVSHHPGRCLGCRYCTWACPHDAPRFDPARGVVEKCGFCLERQAEGREPACVAQCPLGALGFEPRDDAPRAGSPGFPASATGPALRILPGRRPAPAQTAPPDPGLLARCRQAILEVPEPRITARGEWALVVFTTVLGALVAVLTALAARPGRPLPLPPAYPGLAVGAGAGAFALSALHLGRPGRGWRALANLRHSWLSREVALAAGFLALAGLCLLGWPQARGLAWLAAATGLAALFAVDRVYQVAVRTGPLNFHSAHALFNGLYLAGLLAGLWPLALAAGGLKAGLYLHRKAHFRRQGRGQRPLLSLLRLALGFGPALLAFGGGAAVLGALLGDLVDRWEYYGELAIPSPQTALAEQLRLQA